MRDDHQQIPSSDGFALSRRTLLKIAGAGGLTLVTAPPAIACNSAGESTSAISGGTLNSALIAQVAEVANLCAAESFAFLHSRYDPEPTLITDFGGFDEWHIRKPATIAFGVASLIKLGIYDNVAGGITQPDATERVIRLILSLTAQHISGRDGGWGGAPAPWTVDPSHNDWQGALWCHFVSHGAWFIWDRFSEEQQNSILKMVEYEANRFINFTVPYWHDRNGSVNYVGDTKAEESAWNAAMLATAIIMQPNHANSSAWVEKFIELSVSVGSVPSDVTTSESIHGRSVSDIVNGYNLTPDCIVINHGYPNPRYSASLSQNWLNGLLFAYEDKPIPACTLRHGDLIYRAMMDFEFTAPPWNSPGGSYYVAGSASIYYPTNPENYGQQMAPFAAMDAIANSLALDRSSSIAAATWAGLHIEKLHQQVKSSTSYRSEWGLYHAVWTLLAAHIGAKALTLTPASVASLAEQRGPISCERPR